MIDSLREHAKARVHQLRVSTSSLYSFFFYPFVSLNLLTPRMTNSKFKTIQLVVLKHTFLIPNYCSSQMVASSKLVLGIKSYNHLVFSGEWKGCVWEHIVCSRCWGWERQMATGKRAKSTKHDFRYPICRSAIGQASCLICARRRQLTFPFCC